MLLNSDLKADNLLNSNGDLINMKLIETKIENVTVTVEIDENGDHHKWSGSPEIICEGNSCLFEAVDALTVIKALATSETVDEFVEKVSGDNTWKKEKLAEPILKALNKKAIDKVNKAVVDYLDVAFTDDNKDLFEFREDDKDCLNCCLNHYANEFDGRFDKLGEKDQIRYLVQSALADC